MTVLEQILEWSQDRPSWQRDALRRLVLIIPIRCSVRCRTTAVRLQPMLYATDGLDDMQYSDQVVQMWRRLVRTRARDTEWPCGVASGRNNPSLMLGYAGVAYALLRAADPCSVLSILIIERTGG